LFPQEYEGYTKKIPVFFPYKKPFSLPKKKRFSAVVFRENKEWRALVGTALLWMILLGKIILF
jgi:hypothetical protein